ncbi:hypothetical protein F957_01328 [Acinetobacter gyllenbergii CIP 110306 = MTCC 11365]|uniref:Uncharacterized protein n=1 Tax=Acinetobacter gyllenbergii CIP 110306 = MTCC 11365 TaxID=1217657 RepID=A0A829HJZ7_9GAMM|nr:hypothetical protein F957_01328 [Acinetobacter gyllenbergii CIP 110306 = MTCC 11365]
MRHKIIYNKFTWVLCWIILAFPVIAALSIDLFLIPIEICLFISIFYFVNREITFISILLSLFYLFFLWFPPYYSFIRPYFEVGLNIQDTIQFILDIRIRSEGVFKNLSLFSIIFFVCLFIVLNYKKHRCL